MAKEDPESQPKYTFSPGIRVEDKGIKNDINIQIFEQLKENEYYYLWKHLNLPNKQPDKIKAEGTTEHVDVIDQKYAPIMRAPWALVKEPIPHDDNLWNEIKQFIYDHLFLPDENLYDLLTAWIFATWIPEVWSVVPYIFFYGPVASGKTRGLEILHRLSFRAILSSNISSAALFRACEAWKPTLILDETEIYNKQDRNEVIGLLNSGYRRGQYAIRVKTTEQGEILEAFDVFGFKALAGTEGLAATLESRSIMIKMLKNRRKVRLHIDEKKADELRAKLLDWRFKTLTNGELCELCEVFFASIPPLNFESGRLEELFQCLLAVANHGRENIIKYAEKMAEIRQFEEMTSIEATVIEIMLKEDLVLENNVILTKDIADKLNLNRIDREKFKTNSVGWIIRRLGFEPRHTRHGNGWFYDKDRLKYYRSIYLGSEPVAEKSSQTSQTSPISQDKRQTVLDYSTSTETCSNCGVEIPYSSALRRTETGVLCAICARAKELDERSQEYGV